MKRFSARETEWLQELDGIELAPFWRCALAFLFDSVLVILLFTVMVVLLTLLYIAYRKVSGHPVPSLDIQIRPGKLKFDLREGTPFAEISEEWAHLLYYTITPILYFGLLTWWAKGRSPGKWIFRIRVVSIVHRHLSLWHSIERALGYGAAALELGFGFVQFFIHPYRRCAQDRLAETIVVTERSYRELQRRSSHSLLPDADDIPPGRGDDELPEPEA